MQMVLLLVNNFSGFIQPNSPSQSSTPRHEPAAAHHFVPHVLQSEESASPTGAARSLRSTMSTQGHQELATVHNVAEDLSRIQQACADEMAQSEVVIQVQVPADSTSVPQRSLVLVDVDGTPQDFDV